MLEVDGQVRTYKMVEVDGQVGTYKAVLRLLQENHFLQEVLYKVLLWDVGQIPNCNVANFTEASAESFGVLVEGLQIHLRSL